MIIIYRNSIRCIKDQTTLDGAMDVLQDEIIPWDDPSEASPEYRINLTKSLLYKVEFTLIVLFRLNIQC